MASDYLLDTCAWIDAMLAPEKLSLATRKIIEASPRLYLCGVSLIELARKEAKGEIHLEMPLRDWFEKVAFSSEQIQLLPISPIIAADATRLPEPFLNRQGKQHKDPADMIIIATARAHGLTVLTSDQVILDYGNVKTEPSR